MTPADVEAYGGIDCQFTRGCRYAYPYRTRNSMVTELGNAMHVNSMGSVIFALVWRHPWLLAATLPEGTGDVVFAPQVPASIASDDSAAVSAIAEARRQSRAAARALKRQRSA
eukprot:7046001-Pyramimonas_sp.AAC.1